MPSDTTCFQTALFAHPEYRAQRPWWKAAAIAIAAALAAHGDGTLSDNALRAETGLGPKRFRDLCDSLVALGWIERSAEKTLRRAGLLCAPTAAALRMREQRQSGRYPAGEETEQIANKPRTIAEPETPENAAELVSELPNELANSKLEFNSNSLSINSHSELNCAPTDPLSLPPDPQESDIVRALLGVGFQREEARAALERRTVAELYHGIRCAQLQLWDQKYAPAVSLRKYIDGKLTLNNRYTRQYIQQALPMVGSVPGGLHDRPPQRARPKERAPAPRINREPDPIPGEVLEQFHRLRLNRAGPVEQSA